MGRSKGSLIRILRSNKNAISSVLATLILVAVTITIAVAFSFWMSGVVSNEIKTEVLEITNSRCTWSSTDDEWAIELTLKNTGTTPVTLLYVLINDVQVDQYNSTAPAPEGQAVSDMSPPLSISSGASVSVTIFIDGPGGVSAWRSLSSGTVVEIKIHSAGGADHMILQTLT